MAAMRGPRLQVGSAAWVAEERSSALQITQSEVEEFSYSARNELDWLNEHMAGIFNENETNIAETFKTPGKLRGKTPRTARKVNPAETRVPLSDVFAATPNGSTNRAAAQINRLQSPQLQARATKAPGSPALASSPRRNIFSPKPGPATQDSGYYGSQDIGPLNIHADEDMYNSQPDGLDQIGFHTTTTVPLRTSPSRLHIMDSPEKTWQTAKEEQTTRVLCEDNAKSTSPTHLDTIGISEQTAPGTSSPLKSSSPTKARLDADIYEDEHQTQHDDSPADDMRSPSDGSSPIRPMVRKSSLNFASLPAREPLAAGKSIGGRVSRTSHLDHNRTSYYNRPTGGKSLGNLAWPDVTENEEQDEMDVDEVPAAQPSVEADNVALNHNKTYTQRLQDQISKLGKSQVNTGQSKPLPSISAAQQNEYAASQTAQVPKSPASTRKPPTQTTPGAFPEDEDEDDWIEPPTVAPEAADTRPALPKSYSADVMEGIHSKSTIGQPDFGQPKQQNHEDAAFTQRAPAQDRLRPALGHAKSASVSAVPLASTIDVEGPPLTKAATVSNPTVAMLGMDRPETPKSPARSFRDSPLKQVKNKLSSILKSSRGLLASSAAISAEGKSSIMSPSTTRLGFHHAPSSESIIPKPSFETLKSRADSQALEQQGSPTRPAGRRTRASVEREKEEKRREKEAKRVEEQMHKLDKAREKEREKARVFSKEQERIVSMEKKLASKKEPEQLLPKETPKPTRSSPRKARGPEESDAKPVDQDVDMTDAPTMQPPSAPRSAGPGHIVRKEIKRPVKPAKEIQTKTRQAPTVIKVNTGSQHSQYHPATTALPTTARESLASSNSQSQNQQASKASKATLNTKPSTQSLKSSTSSAGRPKALELAAKKKELDERETQRRRDAKVENERKRAAAQEEQRRQEQQRRQEAEKQRQKDREQAAAAEAKKNAQRQAAIEKAKQTRAPPPAVRSQPNGPPDFSLAVGRPSTVSNQPARPPSRMASNMHRSQEDPGRSINTVLPNGAKAGAKRTLPDGNDDNQAKRQPSRGGPAYQAKDAKRRRTSDDHKDELETGNPPNIKGPPVRPSGAFKKDLPNKSMFQNGYSNAPQSATRDLFKATVTAQHSGQVKTAHPLDMAQISKGDIRFAPNQNAAGPSSYKTPARVGQFNAAKSTAKSATRSSPRFQNGDSIELPEIQTDDEDEDDDEPHGMSVAAWADSPDLRRALMRQEGMDPSQIFGPPAPLNMEEVFSKSKERWHKFRARTSSANWSGSDRLTEEEIRKDMVARDKLRREGGWSYEMGKDLL